MGLWALFGFGGAFLYSQFWFNGFFLPFVRSFFQIAEMGQARTQNVGTVLPCLTTFPLLFSIPFLRMRGMCESALVARLKVMVWQAVLFSFVCKRNYLDTRSLIGYRSHFEWCFLTVGGEIVYQLKSLMTAASFHIPFLLGSSDTTTHYCFEFFSILA